MNASTLAPHDLVHEACAALYNYYNLSRNVLSHIVYKANITPIDFELYL